MCDVLSVCVTKEPAEILAVPGSHHHSELVKHRFGDKAVHSLRGQDVVGLEINVRERLIYLDESSLPSWYKPNPHDDALWEWIHESLDDREMFLNWLAEELAGGVARNGGRNRDYALAPMNLRIQAVTPVPDVGELTKCAGEDLALAAAPSMGVDLPEASEDVGLAREAASFLEENSPGWSEPWSEGRPWDFDFEHDVLNRRGVPEQEARDLTVQLEDPILPFLVPTN